MTNIETTQKLKNIVENLRQNSELHEVLAITTDKYIHHDENEFMDKIQKEKPYRMVSFDNCSISVYKDKTRTFLTFKYSEYPDRFSWIICTNETFQQLESHGRLSWLIEQMKKSLILITVLLLAAGIMFFGATRKNLVIETSREHQYTSDYSRLFDSQYSGKDIKLVEDKMLSDPKEGVYIFANLAEHLQIKIPNIQTYILENKSSGEYYSMKDLREKKMFSLTNIDTDKSLHEMAENYWFKTNTPYSFSEIYPLFIKLNKNEKYSGSLEKINSVINKFAYIPKEILDKIIWDDSYKNLLNQKYFQEQLWCFWVCFYLNNNDKSSQGYMSMHWAILDSILKKSPAYLETKQQNINTELQKKYTKTLQEIKKLDTLWFFQISEPKNLNIEYSIGIDLNLGYSNNTEFLNKLLEIKNNWNPELFKKTRDLAGLDKRLLLSVVDIQGDEKWFDQLSAQLYMTVFDLSKDDFRRSIELGYNIKLDSYIKSIFPGEDPYLRKISFVSPDISSKYYIQALQTEVVNRPYNSDILHEIGHLIFDKANDDAVQNKKLSLHDYFSNFDQINSSTSTANWEIWTNFLSKIYLSKLSKTGDVTPPGMTAYSTYNQNGDFSGVWWEYMTDIAWIFLTNPGYYAYIDLYGWEGANITRSWIQELLKIFAEYKIFSSSDYEYYKSRARELHEAIENQ